MRLLVMTQYFPPEIGAAHTRLQAMVRELKELGHDVQVVTALPNYPVGKIFPEYRGCFYRREVLEGVTVHRVWLYAALGGGFARMLNYLSFSITALYGLCKAGKHDYLFVESPPLLLSLTAYLYSRLTGAKFILNVSDLWPDAIVEMGIVKRGFALDLLYLLEDWSYRQADYVNAITEGIRDILRDKKGVAADKLLYLPNGVDTRRFRPQPPDVELKARLGLAGKNIVLYAGTQGSAHGLENVLRAAKLLEARPEIRFVFLGDGSERKSLEKLQREMELQNVIFLDPVSLEKLPPYYSIAATGLVSLRDIPIFDSARPSKMFPIMASGKPMIFFGKGEGARLLEQANAGLVVPPENAEALAEAVSRLLGNPDLAMQLGSNGRRFVEEHHEWRKLIADWVADLAQPEPIERVVVESRP